MGNEKHFTRTIMAMILGLGRADMGSGLDFNRDTPNHRALAVACGYGWSLRFGTEAQKKRAKERIRGELCSFQDKGHYTWAETNECLTASHYNWWGVAFAALRWFAQEAKDEEVLRLTGKWWRQEMAVLALMSVPSGRLQGCIVAPGGRTVYTPDIPASGGSVPRDVVYRLIMGLKVKKDADWFRQAEVPIEFYEKRIDDPKPALDLTAPWLVRGLINKFNDDFGRARAAGKAALEGDLSNLPKLFDRLRIVRTPKGHVAWFEDMTGTKGEPPQYWAWCDYEAGDQKYGLEKPMTKPPAPPGGFEGNRTIEV